MEREDLYAEGLGLLLDALEASSSAVCGGIARIVPPSSPLSIFLLVDYTLRRIYFHRAIGISCWGWVMAGLGLSACASPVGTSLSLSNPDWTSTVAMGLSCGFSYGYGGATHTRVGRPRACISSTGGMTFVGVGSSVIGRAGLRVSNGPASPHELL